MNKLFGNKRVRYRNLILIILPFLLLCGFFGFISYKSAKSLVPSEDSESDYKYSIESMNYYLRPNATKLQVDYFHELQDLVNDGASNAEIAACVAKNYIADFYTWTNKSGSYDIGGMHYVYSPQKVNIITHCRDSYYKYLTFYINTFGQENMLEVTDVEAVVGETPTTYEIDGKQYEAYYVTCDWTYKNAETFKDILITISNQFETKTIDTFITKVFLTIILNENGRFEIVEAIGEI